MTTPQFGVPSIIGYGNGASTNGYPPSIDTRVTAGFAPTMMHAPTFSPRPMPMLDRVTPRSVQATQALTTVRAKLTTLGNTNAQRAINNVLANARAARMHAKRLLPTDTGHIMPPTR